MARTPGKLVYTGRHVKVTFKMDRKGIAECARGPELTHAVQHLAETRGLPLAIALSPRSDREDHIHYQDSWTVLLGSETIRGMLRVAAYVYNRSPHAAAVEWGNQRVGDGHYVLTQILNHLNSLGHDHN